MGDSGEYATDGGHKVGAEHNIPFLYSTGHGALKSQVQIIASPTVPDISSPRVESPALSMRWANDRRANRGERTRSPIVHPIHHHFGLSVDCYRSRRWRRRRRYMQISRARRAAAATAVAEVRPHTAIIIIIEPEWRRAAPRLPNRLPSRLGPAESSGGGGRGNGEEGDDGNVLFDVASVFRKQKGRIFFAFGSFWTRFSARRSR